MKLLKKVFLLLMITCCSHNLFADDDQEEYLRKIAGIIQKTAEMRFGGDLNVGDKVKYEYRDDSQAEEFKFHSLEVVSKSSDKVTILEKFEGNNLIISYNPKNFEVLEIKGNDIVGKEYTLSLLNKNELKAFDSVTALPFMQEITDLYRLNKTKTSQPIKGKSKISCQIIELNPDKGSFLGMSMQEMKESDSHMMTVSHDVPKLLPLIPVSLNNYSMKDLLKRENCGLVENNLLKLKDFEKVE